MRKATGVEQFRALAQFRYLVREYLNGTEKACTAVGFEPLHYSVLLQLVGLPADQRPTIGYVAKRLYLRHHSAVELIDRMEKRKLVRRVRAREDRRIVELHVTPGAKALLKRLVSYRMQELAVLGPAFARSINACFRNHPRSRSKGRSTPRKIHLVA